MIKQAGIVPVLRLIRWEGVFGLKVDAKRPAGELDCAVSIV